MQSTPTRLTCSVLAKGCQMRTRGGGTCNTTSIALPVTIDLIKLGVLNQASSQLLKDTFTRLSHTTLQFGLSHGDLSERNTIVDAQAKVWLVDWGCANAHVIPHFDFDGVLSSNVAADTLEFASFLAGYGMTRERFEKLHPQIQDFSLLQATDKLRWAIDKKPERI